MNTEPNPPSPSGPNPKRVAAGRLNRQKRVGTTPEGLARLRDAALAGRPWEGSTGPKSSEGKARSAGNGRSKQSGAVSARQVKREVAAAMGLIAQMTRARAQAAPIPTRGVHEYRRDARAGLTPQSGGYFAASRSTTPPTAR